MAGLYIHIPFCKQKCSYCDFVSFGGREAFLPPYLHALKNEAQKFKDEKIETVFIGGGTPSLMSSVQINDLCDFLHNNFKIDSNAEITMEANPQSLTMDKLTACKNGGINRISVGAQSLSDEVLSKIGRCHTLKEFEQAIDNIKKANFNNFNLDLIFALPDQTLEMWQKTLEKAVQYESTHISCYSLIVDPETPLGALYARNEINLPDEETERLMYKSVKDILFQNGIYQYEISNYAKKGFECKHNVSYWECKEYIGLGCAAHSYYNGIRYNNTTSLERYIKQEDIVCNKEIITLKDMQEEMIMLGFRMNKGINIKEFNNKFNCNFLKKFGKTINKFKNTDLLKIEENQIFLSEKGLDVCDSVVLEFLCEI